MIDCKNAVAQTVMLSLLHLKISSCKSLFLVER